MRRVLPETAKPYARSPVFTASTVPAKLLGEHDLKAGTFGYLHVEAGRVDYFRTGKPGPCMSVNAGEKFVILPEEKHLISVSDDAVFFIEFCK